MGRFRSVRLLASLCTVRTATLVAGSALIAGMVLRGFAQAATVTLSPGANIQAAVTANPAGTTFVLQPGVYRLQAVMPLTGDIFTGQTGADLNGSQVLTNWVQNGLYWTITGAPAQNNPLGSPGQYCNDPTTGCNYPQDLYLNNVPLVHKLALPITSGQWYFDYGNDVIYMANNPIGQTVELSVSNHAFTGSASNVTVQNLIVEKYASPLGDTGAIGPHGPNWTIKSNEVRLNHGAGIKPGAPGDNYEQILSNNAHDNGQQGIGLSGGTGSLIQSNTSTHNNIDNISDGYEEGGGKVAAVTNTRVLNNTFSNNNGMGLWGDSYDSGVTFSGNTVSGNRLDGIRYEISHHGTISNNTLTNNGQYMGTGPCSLNGAHEIGLAQSDNTTVSNNTITSNCAGIIMTSGSRNTAVNDVITHNTTTYNGSTVIQNLIGGLDTNVPTTMFNPSSGNYYDYNTYHFGGALGFKNWTWNGAPINPLTWSGWQTAGEDPNGSAN